MRKGGILYLTADGLLQPLGFSQVVRVVEALAFRGWSYSIFSLERGADLAHTERVGALKRRLRSRGVSWRFEVYEEGGAAAAARNEAALVRAAVGHRGAGVHARAYHGAIAALAGWTARRTPYLFDTRSYWFDERLEEGRWFTTPIRLAVARGLEHQLFAQALGVVTLTELQADDVRSGRFGPARQRAIRCIPTCADFEDFFRRAETQRQRVPVAIRERLKGKRVLGIVGSINRSYLVDETLQLAALVLRRDPSAHLLVLSSQCDGYLHRLSTLGVAPERFTVTSAHHDAMPEWLSFLHWGMLLLNPASPAKRASMPTKLAEFLACGVRPVQFGCNAELSEWVLRTGSGLILPDVGGPSLEATSERICRDALDENSTERARKLAAPHFSLESGVERYEQVLLQCFGDLRGLR